MSRPARKRLVSVLFFCLLFFTAARFTGCSPAMFWARRSHLTDLLSAIYVIITLLFIYSKQKEIFRLFHDFWDRFVPAQERGENPEPVVYGQAPDTGKEA